MRQALLLIRFSGFALVLAVTLFWVATGSTALAAATDTIAASDLPTSSLRPPCDEIPPSFWDQHGTESILAGLGAVAVLGAILWLLTRSKPIDPVRPAVQARH